MGVPVEEACARAVQRVQSLKRESTLDSMHSSLVVGIVAMDISGRIGAASTLCAENQHRGKPFFPVATWMPSRGCGILEASSSGAALAAMD